MKQLTVRKAAGVGFLLAALVASVVEVSAAIAFRSAAQASAGSGALTLTISKPTGTVSGDVMVAAIAVRPGTATITAPAEWTLVRTDFFTTGTSEKLSLYRKVATASEPANYSWTFDTSTGSAGGILAFLGVDTTTPIDVSGGQQTTGSTTDVPAPSVTTTVANAMLVTAHAMPSSGTSGSAWTPPTGMTEAVDISSSSGTGGESVEMNYVLQAAVGATGTKTAIASGNDNTDNLASVLALRPAADHMVVTATDGAATVGGSEVLTLQLVDQFGNAVSSALAVTVTVTGSATFSANDIGGTNGTNTLNGTLSASGSGSVTITDGVAETVTVSADATGDFQVVANVDDTVVFDLLPTLAVDDGRLFYGETGTAQALQRTWDDSLGTWSAEGGTAPVSGTVRWTVNKIAPNGGEDLLAVHSDPGGGTELNLIRWDGTAWSVDWTSTAITSANANKRAFDVEYEAASGDALVVYSNNTNTPVYRARSGGSWSGETPLPLNDGPGPNPDPNAGIVLWVELAARPGSNEITLAYVDANWDLVAMVWDGTQWETLSVATLETNVTQSRGVLVVQNRAFDVAYEESTGDAMIAWGRHNVGGFFYSTRAAGSNSWSAATGVLGVTTK